jgi:hypothetical protein
VYTIRDLLTTELRWVQHHQEGSTEDSIPSRFRPYSISLVQQQIPSRSGQQNHGTRVGMGIWVVQAPDHEHGSQERLGDTGWHGTPKLPVSSLKHVVARVVHELQSNPIVTSLLSVATD